MTITKSRRELIAASIFFLICAAPVAYYVEMRRASQSKAARMRQLVTSLGPRFSDLRVGIKTSYDGTVVIVGAVSSAQDLDSLDRKIVEQFGDPQPARIVNSVYVQPPSPATQPATTRVAP